MLTRLIKIVLNNGLRVESRGESRSSQMSTLKNIIGVILCLSLVTSLASAQNGQAGSSRSQAVLTIQVNVAPIVVSPQAQTANAQATAITYDIPTAPARFNVTEKIQEQLVTGAPGQIQHQVVKIITVVLD
jgi:hypothetical protein